MSAPPPSQKDGQQVLKYAFDDASGKLRVDAVISPDGHDLEIHHEDDSIAIGTSTELFTATTIGPKIGLDVNVISPITIDTTGLATSANQLTEINELTDIASSVDAIDGKLNTLGQKISSGSVPVVISSDQSPIPVTATFTPSGTQDVNIVSTISLPVTGPLTDAELRASSVPVDGSGVTQPVSIAATVVVSGTVSSTQSGSWDVSVNNAAGAAAVNIQDGGNSITIDGSVTANAGTNLNTSLLALDSTVAKDTSLTTINTSVNTLLKPANTLAAVTTLGSITNALPAGSNVIGHVITDSGSVVNATLSAETTKVIGTVNQGTSPWVVSGTVTANAGSNLNTSALALDSTVAKDNSLTTLNTSVNTLLKPANTLTAVTTLGTITNVVHVDDNSGSLTVDNNGTFAVQAAATLAAETTKVIGTVNISSGQTVALAAGAAVIGHVITDSGSVVNATLSAETTKVIGTVNQGTSPWVTSNNNAGGASAVNVQDGGNSLTVDNNGTFAVQATLAAETTKVIGTVNVSAAQTIAVTNSGTFAVQNTPAVVSTSSTTTVASSGSNVQLLASTAGRKMATFYNESTAVLYLKLGVTASLTSYTVQIPASGYYELPAPIFTGEIDGIWATANGNVRITELS